MTEDDGGFTLIEAVIAMFVMAVAVVTLMGGLVTLIDLSREHRGHAAVETAARSFGQAVTSLAQAPVYLKTSVTTTTGTSIFVKDATTLPAPSTTPYLFLEQEVVRLTAVNRATGELTVQRGQAGSTPATHVVSAARTPAVYPVLACPSTDLLTPDPASYTIDPGTEVEIVGVEYLNASGDFADASGKTCKDDYEELCPGGQMLPECEGALYRLTLEVTTPNDERLNDRETTTKLLIRSGVA